MHNHRIITLTTKHFILALPSERCDARFYNPGLFVSWNKIFIYWEEATSLASHTIYPEDKDLRTSIAQTLSRIRVLTFYLQQLRMTHICFAVVFKLFRQILFKRKEYMQIRRVLKAPDIFPFSVISRYYTTLRRNCQLFLVYLTLKRLIAPGNSFPIGWIVLSE